MSGLLAQGQQQQPHLQHPKQSTNYLAFFWVSIITSSLPLKASIVFLKISSFIYETSSPILTYPLRMRIPVSGPSETEAISGNLVGILLSLFVSPLARLKIFMAQISAEIFKGTIVFSSLAID